MIQFFVSPKYDIQSVEISFHSQLLNVGNALMFKPRVIIALFRGV